METGGGTHFEEGEAQT